MSWDVTETKHTIWFGKGSCPYPEHQKSFERLHPKWKNLLWTLNNRPRDFPLLEDMLVKGHRELAVEYFKIKLLTKYTGLYMDYNVRLDKAMTDLNNSAWKYGYNVAKYPYSDLRMDYLSSAVMAAPKILQIHVRYTSWALDLERNYEYFYREGVIDPGFYGDNILSRLYRKELLSKDEVKPNASNPALLEFRSPEVIFKAKKYVIPYQAFYADVGEEDHPLYLGRVLEHCGHE